MLASTWRVQFIHSIVILGVLTGQTGLKHRCLLFLLRVKVFIAEDIIRLLSEGHIGQDVSHRVLVEVAVMHSVLPGEG